MKILIASSEFYPLTNNQDVSEFVSGLAGTLAQLGHDVRVILPAYPEAINAALPIESISTLELVGCEESVRILQADKKKFDLPVYLVEAKTMFSKRGNPYLDTNGVPRTDNLERFAMFSQVIFMMSLNQTGINWKPDVVHLNDWQTGLASALLAQDWNRPATVFSCHNLTADFNFPVEMLDPLKLPAAIKNSQSSLVNKLFSPGMAGLNYSDVVVTASDSSAALPASIKKPANHIFNIKALPDASRWSPANDRHIPQSYDASTSNLKSKNKTAIQNQLNLTKDEKSCLVTIFSDLTDDRFNSELIHFDMLEPLLEKHPVQLVLCNRQAEFLKPLQTLSERYPNRLAICNKLSEKLLHEVISGSDVALFSNENLLTRLLPLSCCRYGTLPVIGKSSDATGGICDASGENLMKNLATGFLYTNSRSELLLPILEKLVQYYLRTGPWWKKLSEKCMQQFAVNQHDHLSTAHQYLESYQFAIDNPVSNPDK
ncbi:MAG: glycogen/starch synthase [Gammaproteobacteria bacterium]